MRIVIDLQSAQGNERLRGIGRYSLSLALATARQRGDHEVFIALSDLFPETIEPLRAAFDGVLPHDHVRVWHAPGPAARFRGTNELVREAFLAELRPDIVHIAGLLASHQDAAATISRFTDAFPVAATLYDLIPHVDPAHYLTDSTITAWYRDKLDHLARATLLLAISESTRREALEHLAIRPEQVVTVLGAADPSFRPIRLAPAVRDDLLARHGIRRPFLMYTGGDDHRKNLTGIIRTFARLPEAVRRDHQLVLVGALPPGRCDALRALAASLGLRADDVILSGQVTEEDLLLLYNACMLFVFPSLHEGLGLPLLEAMSCGAPVVASNTTSMPEVIGRDDALFDPRSDASISAKILEALTDHDFRAALARHGLERAKTFSWDESARRAIAAFERVHASRQARPRRAPSRAGRPRLAYVSPWPPDRSGIADVSAELLPELSRHYEIELITSSQRARKFDFRPKVTPRDPRWLYDNRDRFDRVLYHFGNSTFHSEMFDLLPVIPGTVVLHDFFLGHVLAGREVEGGRSGIWSEALYRSHGYLAVQERFHSQNLSDVVFRYPVNLDVLQHARGMIVHSDFARQLAARWYGGDAGRDWAVVPLPRAPSTVADRAAARRALRLPQDAFVVGCFGMLGPLKLDDRVLSGWLASSLADDPGSHLVFVGENHGAYGEEIRRAIERSRGADRIRTTGYAKPAVYRRYLAAVDMAVQLRTQSRGETSAAVLDCMSHGVPTIVNACGAMAELPRDAVWVLPEDFDDAALAGAFDALRRDPGRRAAMGERAREAVRTRHHPAVCADAYADAIERFDERERAGVPGLIEAIAAQDPLPNDTDRGLIAAAIAANHPVLRPARRLFVDVSAIVWTDLRTGVQRVTRSMLLALLHDPPAGFRVEPVYATADLPGYRYARRITCELLECPYDWASDEMIEPQAGDVYFGLDLHAHVTAAQAETLDAYRRHGVRLFQLMYDILPVRRPDCFHASDTSLHARWLQTITRFDGVVAISRAVAEDFVAWLAESGPEREDPIGIGWCHLGADVEFAGPTRGMAPDAAEVLRHLRAGASFLLVGTIEPRKGVAQTLAAFERLWEEGLDARLVLVGRRGWMVEPLIARLERHAELGRRLIWLPSASDEYLTEIYAASTCLIAASEGEGFGLPLIEAARLGLPILARDIPVFREVAGDHATYFQGGDADALAAAVHGWLTSYREGRHPRSDAMPWLTWRQSTRDLLALIIGDRWPIRWRRTAGPALTPDTGDEHQPAAAGRDTEDVD